MYRINCSVAYRLISSRHEGSAFANIYKYIDYQINVNDDASEDAISKQVMLAGIEEIRKVEGSDASYDLVDFRFLAILKFK